MSNNKTYRIRAKENEEYVDLNLNLNQDIDTFEILSLKIDSTNFYKLQTSNYGCVAGRVLANNAIGVPNVKLSIFIGADENTSSNSVLNSLYPYKNVFDKNNDGARYNLLTEEEVSECQKTSGTFPSKRMVLDDNNVFEIFDKYYKFTTTTNASGDYMIFGVPVGTQQLHLDVDLSNIGTLLSQSPRDFIYKGYDRNLFESPSQFKTGTDLDSLPQIMSQNESIYVYPFWGDPTEMKENDSTGVRISRKDINLNYKFEPTCIFFGSIISDEKSNGFSEKCVPTDRMGKMDKITTGEGTIEMIRKTPDGDVESFNIGGTHLIDGDGTWCYQIPMNLDYVRTDENGNIVPSDNPNAGLPTRTRVRFRFSLNDFASDYENNHLCKVLVPNNPENYRDNIYNFGTKTDEEDFRDLLWNKIYSVKSYIPRIQKSDTNKEKRFSGIKTVNVNGSNNPMPYNNIRVDITFMFVLQCAIMHALIWLTGFINHLTVVIIQFLLVVDNGSSVDFSKYTCTVIGDGACPDMEGWYFAPRCLLPQNDKCDLIGQTMKQVDNKVNGTYVEINAPHVGTVKDTAYDIHSISYTNKEKDQNGKFRDKVCVTAETDYFMKCVELALAKEYEVIQFDFYNDWINGTIYIPRWFASIKKARSLLFGLIKTKERVRGCMEEVFTLRRRYTQQCALYYELDNISDPNSIKIKNNYGCQNGVERCHKGKGRKNAYIFKPANWKPGGGIVHPELTSKNQQVYYFRPRDFKKEHGAATKKFVTFFATDIILLGSISENDIDGIPFISELISSSYKMPTSLASTNMDIMGEMFGSTLSGGTRCNTPSIPDDVTFRVDGQVSNVILTTASTVSDTFSSFKTWAQYDAADDGYDTSNDPNEYPLTEASGIDWGYTGPEQKDITTVGSTYKPGGHFLGLSCFDSETNVKTCLNLSRICEIGVNISNRKTIEKLNSSEIDMYAVPTGLISDFDIYDGDFRSLFATLNHNGLKTEEDVESGRYKYSLIPMHIHGFDGAMKNYARWDGLNTYNEAVAKIYALAPEVFDKNYYDFRMGLNNKNDYIVEYVYLEFDNGEYRVSLPMYNNSFYFYFGLHDGATALDKFHEKFYGNCKEID